MRKKRLGTSLGSLFEELGEEGEVELLRNKKILAASLRQAMEQGDITESNLAKKMRTSRTLVRRLLNPSDTGVTLATLTKASSVLGFKFSVKLEKKRRTPVAA